jgi:sulfur carrier protein ThiS
MITVGDQQLTWRPGMTLAQVLNLFEADHAYAVARLNGKLVARPNFSVTPVPDDAVVGPIPLIAGG